MGREGVSANMGGVTNEKVLAFGGVEVQILIFRPAGAGILIISWWLRGQ